MEDAESAYREMEQRLRRYTNNALTTAEVITELVALAKEVHADRDRETGS